MKPKMLTPDEYKHASDLGILVHHNLSLPQSDGTANAIFSWRKELAQFEGNEYNRYKQWYETRFSKLAWALR